LASEHSETIQDNVVLNQKETNRHPIRRELNVTLDLAWIEMRAWVEKTLDAWLGERVVLYALRYLLVLLTCFVTGILLLRVLGILSYCQRFSPVERPGGANGREKVGRCEPRTMTVALRPTSMRSNIGAEAKEEVAADIDKMPDIGDSCVSM
jgi:hypothetical protein